MAPTDRLDAVLDEEGLAAVWFGQPNSFAWLTGGDNVVSADAGPGVAAAGYDGESITVVTNNIEAPRLAEEELDADVELVAYQWYESSLAEAVAAQSPTPAAADFDVPGVESIDPSDLRQPLTDDDVSAYRSLGDDAAAAVEAVCEELTPETTEREATGRLLDRLAADGIRAPVALVGGGERAATWRHYTPKSEPLGDYALLSVTGVRDGLHTSVTRTVAFDEPDWLVERTEAAATVEATALAATREVGREGGTASDVFAAVQDAYEAVGYPGEWRNHHQGGAAGYAGREWKATPTSDREVFLPMAYAWNPTVQGAKSENTWLVAEDGFECLSAGQWTTEPVEAVGYDVTLERAEIYRP
ncbi:MAG: M24 family metallopeptidase [Halobacteriaceae archaeon]